MPDFNAQNKKTQDYGRKVARKMAYPPTTHACTKILPTALGRQGAAQLVSERSEVLRRCAPDSNKIGLRTILEHCESIRNYEKKYLERQTLGRQVICPIGPTNQRKYYIVDCRISKISSLPRTRIPSATQENAKSLWAKGRPKDGLPRYPGPPLSWAGKERPS